MIRLQKGSAPQVLVDNAIQWRDNLLGYYNRDETPPKDTKNAYNHADIKSALEAETAGKCMYCEGKIKDLGYNHIEHYKPKARDKYPELTFDWNNLGIACPACNTNKGEEFDEAMPYVNPYVDEPNDHFRANGAFVFHITANSRGQLSATKLKLNRPGLIEKRGEAIGKLNDLIAQFNGTTQQLLKSTLRDQIWEECAKDREYSFVLKAVASSAGVPQ